MDVEGSCKWNPYANDREESLSIQERLSSQRHVQEWSHSGCWDVPLGLPPAAGSVACHLWELSLAKGSGLSQGSSSLGKPPSDHWSVWGTGTQSCHLHLGPHWRVSSELPQGPLKLHPSLTLPSIHPTLLPSLPSPENICALIAFRSVSRGLWPSTSYPLASCPLGTVITHFRAPPPSKGLGGRPWLLQDSYRNASWDLSLSRQHLWCVPCTSQWQTKFLLPGTF